MTSVRDYQSFSDNIARELEKTGQFSEVKQEIHLDGMIVDILATPLNGDFTTLALELKFRSVTTASDVLEAASRSALIKSRLPNAIFVLLTTGKMTERARAAATELSLPVIAAEDVNLPSSNDLLAPIADVVRGLTGNKPTDTKSENLLMALQTTEEGTPGWVQYQKLCCNILEYLFCPPLGTPKYENPDAARRNRRDIIFGNPCENGFWSTLRQHYSAHYVVVDAKNYSNKIQKKPIIEMGHYLKRYGCGLFGIIVSRHGIAPSGLYAMREQWISSDKMIVVLSDEDVIDMLRLKGARGNPEEIISLKIDDFRTSL